MRLNSIKLSGFKSFAESTQFQLPGQLVGVVGPNGCGKSNIIDAVRWVLGESKASELRGESMQDVIFSGAASRKPASRASVELVFSNEDARAGGQWNQYAEIAVRRVLTRDGASSYYINGQPVRRRDVQDVFLGTGLGPRAYAIIGQGTISRIIESRPEELRLFLEEAAGVSKYKERRRETENRLRDTRENLTRVDDILRELNSQLEKLEQQAEVAGRYRALQDSGTRKLHQSWWLKHRDAGFEAQRVEADVAAAVNALESRSAELRRGEAELEAIRQQHYAEGDALHVAQGSLAEAALEVSRLEERIRYVVEGRRRAEARLAELQAQRIGWARRADDATAELADNAAHIEAADERGAVLLAQVEAGSAEAPLLEDARRTAQAAADRQRAEGTVLQQQIQVLAAESRGIADQRRQGEARRERLHAERQRLAAPDADRLAELVEQCAAAEGMREQAEAVRDDLAQQVPALDDERRAGQAVANAEGASQAELAARLQALRTLQEKVQTSGKLAPWLARHGLAGLPALWTRLHVEPGWETALEAALRERIGALEIGRLDHVRAFADDSPPAKLVFHGAASIAPGGAARPAGAGELTAPTAPPAAAPAGTPNAVPSAAQSASPAAFDGSAAARLFDRLRFSADAADTLRPTLADWLHGVWCAERLDDALAQRAGLAAGHLVVTRAGHAVSAHAVAFHAPDSEQAGLLARAQEIENLDRQSRAQSLLAEAARAALVRAEAAFTAASAQLSRAQRDATETQSRAHQLQVEQLRLAQQAEQSAARRSRLTEDLAELDATLDDLLERTATGEGRFEELDARLGDAQQRHADLEDTVIGAERVLAEHREQLRAFERQAQEAQFQSRALAARRAELARAIETAQQQLVSHDQTAVQLADELERLADASAEAGLQQALALRVEREQALFAVRQGYDALTARLRGADEQRLAHEQSLAPLRERVGRLQLEAQAAQLGGAQFAEQLTAAGLDATAIDALAESIARDGVKLNGLQAEIDRIQREVAALGAVNLAALDELGASRERKQFLDAQCADLNEAIGTLEGAIHKIDLETRELLSSTFDTVNAHFGRMFPTLFGGGTARLAMTGAEILDSGVQVMAQPPGKRNTSIHLLSGGEKALTAIALVFAIFQLNPAPFCLLDEVDAPLDDANTERYAKLVREMSAGTQFLFISHNRIAMEMAQQLIGVTMQEQGVSRIVAVDVGAAVELAEAVVA